MDFVEELTKRIRKQIGLDFASNEAFSLLQPTGNEHLIQFFVKDLPDEYLDLDLWDRHHLYLCDLSSGLDLEFSLDDSGQFASLSRWNGQPPSGVQAVLDLRDDYILTLYFFGDSKSSLRLNQQLLQAGKISPCFLEAVLFEQRICDLETITRVEFDFEQQNSLFLEPIVLKGVAEGTPAQKVYGQYLQHFKPNFNIKSICGHLTDDAQGNLTFTANGFLQADECRLTDFIAMAKQFFLLLRMKYKSLVDKCLIGWESPVDKRCAHLKGSSIEIWLAKPVDKLEGLLRYLTRGDKFLQLFGVSERVSRKLWSVKSIEIDTGAQIELEVSARMLRVFLQNKKSIPILDKIEDYIQRHITTDFENLTY